MGKSRRSTEAGEPGREGAAGGQPNSDSTPASFESALEQLEGTVARLEEGEMPLEEALELFESGVKLSRQCSKTLEQAERRIEILVADRGLGDDTESVPFDFEEDFEEEFDESSEEDGDGQQDDEDFED